MTWLNLQRNIFEISFFQDHLVFCIIWVKCQLHILLISVYTSSKLPGNVKFSVEISKLEKNILKTCTILAFFIQIGS
jgi:hypothetical protein